VVWDRRRAPARHAEAFSRLLSEHVKEMFAARLASAHTMTGRRAAPLGRRAAGGSRRSR
jgi:hypothetical protein